MTRPFIYMITVGVIMGLIAYFVNPIEVALMIDLFFLLFALFCFIADYV